MKSYSDDSHSDPVAKGDMAGWTPESRRVYLDSANRLLSQGWELVKTSELTPSTERFGYSPDRPGAMFTWVVFVHRAEMKSYAIWQFGHQANGAPRTVHGGIICSAVDHTCGAHLIHGHTSKPCVTLKLAVDYQRPVALESPVIIEGKIDKVEGKKYHMSCRMMTPDRTKTYNTAKTLFLQVAPEHFGVKSQM